MPVLQLTSCHPLTDELANQHTSTNMPQAVNKTHGSVIFANFTLPKPFSLWAACTSYFQVPEFFSFISKPQELKLLNTVFPLIHLNRMQPNSLFSLNHNFTIKVNTIFCLTHKNFILQQNFKLPNPAFPLDYQNFTLLNSVFPLNYHQLEQPVGGDGNTALSLVQSLH